jgi:aspartate 1-decarboxylase
MKLKTFVSAKLHGLRVTGKSLDYNGSASLPRSLMREAGISPFEQVHIVNKHNGNRWMTYAIEGNEGEFTLNGAAARQGEIGDECLLFTFRLEEVYSGAVILFLDERNAVRDRKQYGTPLSPDEMELDENDAE